MSRTLRGFWNKTPAPQQPQTPPIDQEAHAKVMNVTTRLQELKTDAEREKLTLKGTLEDRRAEVMQALDNKQYDRAVDAVNALRVDFDKEVLEKQKWVAKKNDYDQTKNKLDEMTTWKVPEAPRLLAAMNLIDDRVTKEQFTPCVNLLLTLKPKVDELHKVAVLRRPAQESFEKAYDIFKISYDDEALKLPDAVPPQLKAERKTIEDGHNAVLVQRDKAEYAEAEKLLPPLSRKAVKLIADRKIFEEAKNKFLVSYSSLGPRIQTIIEMDDDIPDDRRLKKQEVFDLSKTVMDERAVLHFAEAQVALDDLKNNKLVPLETFKTQHDLAKPKFQKQWSTYRYSAEEIVNYPQDKVPQSFKVLQKAVKDAYDPLVVELTARKYFEAEAGIAALKVAVEAALDVKRKHDLAMRNYYAGLKTLRPRLKAADLVAANPPTLQTKIDTYTNKKGEMIVAQDARDYTLANTKRGELETAVTDLLAARKVALLSVLDTATDPAVVATNVKKLAPEEIAELGAAKQNGLLKKLRTGTDGNPHDLTAGETEARNHLYDCIPLDEEFVKADRKKRDKIIKTLGKDKKFIKARDEWDTLSNEERKEFIVHAAKVQCKVMGHPEPEIKFVTKRKCKNPACGDKNQEKEANLFPPCPTCNQNILGFDYGGCGSQLDPATGAGVITINTIPDAKFDDFAEQLDTIMHENAHAYQLELVYKKLAVDPPKIKPTDPEYQQAVLFYENDLVGYETDGDTYNNQPLEKHAWTFGPAIRNGLLGPNVKRLAEGQVTDDEDVA